MCGGGWQNGTLFGSAANRRDFQGGDTALHGLLQLLEGAQLDLADALARNAELVRQLVKLDRLLRPSARLEYATLALAQYGQRVAQRLAAVVGLFALRQPGFLAGAVIDQPVLPLARIGFLADRRVEG